MQSVFKLTLSYKPCHITPRGQLQCGVYWLFLFFTSIIDRFGEYLPPETARIGGCRLDNKC